MPFVSPFVGFAFPFFASALRLLTEKGVRSQELVILRIYGVLFFGGMIPKSCAIAKSVLTRFGDPCDIPFRSSGIIRSPHKEKK
jgi:hypothetical protein